MTGSEIAQIITSSATLLAVIGSLAVSLRNGRGIKAVQEQTDGINAQLVKVTGEAEHAKGVKQGEESSSGDPVKVEIVKIPPVPSA